MELEIMLSKISQIEKDKHYYDIARKVNTLTPILPWSVEACGS